MTCRTRRFTVALAITVAALFSTALRAQDAPSAAQRKDVQSKISAAVVETAGPDDSIQLPAPHTFSHKHKISSSYDRFTQRTLVTAEIMKSHLMNMNLMSIDAYFGYAGKVMTLPPKHILFSFRPDNEGDNWRFLKDHSVIFLADDSVSVPADETEHDGDVGRDFGGRVEVHEYITAWLQTREYLKLVSAKKLEVRMGTYTHTFKDDELEALRDLGSRIVTAMAATDR